MTIDCDERRQAAAEFRRAAREQYEFDGENFLDCVGTYLGDAYTDRTAWARLADLIDPTCTMCDAKWDNGECTWGCICSNCHAHLEHEHGENLRYCPRCGARVVSVDE